MKGDMKTKGFLTALIVGMCLLHTNLYGQWPKPADYQWNLNNIKPYFDTVKLDLEVVEWSNGSHREPMQLNFETTEDWQVHALLIFMGVQARNHVRFVEPDTKGEILDDPTLLTRAYYFDDWTVYIRAREEKGIWSLKGTLVHVSQDAENSELLTLMEFTSL
jgi:hypothetical protein